MTLYLILACITVGSDDTAGDTPTTWEGTEQFLYGYGQSGTDLACDMRWTTTGIAATNHYCPTCEFVFDVELVYDEENSTQDGSCDEFAGDTTAVYGYVETTDLSYHYPGYDVRIGTIGTIEDNTFIELGTADWDRLTGTFTYAWGTMGYGYDYGYDYYTDYRSGSATLR